jgi:hypothetical protein
MEPAPFARTLTDERRRLLKALAWDAFDRFGDHHQCRALGLLPAMQDLVDKISSLPWDDRDRRRQLTQTLRQLGTLRRNGPLDPRQDFADFADHFGSVERLLDEYLGPRGAPSTSPPNAQPAHLPTPARPLHRFLEAIGRQRRLIEGLREDNLPIVRAALAANTARFTAARGALDPPSALERAAAEYARYLDQFR